MEHVTAVFLVTLITTASASNSCIITVNYVLCNEVPISTLQAGTYPMNVTTIKAIHFNNNNLTHLKDDVFNTTPLIKFIVIIHNLIESLHSKLFWNLKELVHLDLTCNQITFISNNIFIYQNKLNNLLLGCNKMTYLDSRVLTPLVKLTSLDLKHNPFVCNCELKNVIDFCNKRNLASNTTCNNGILWTKINTRDICTIKISHTTSATTTTIISENLIKQAESTEFNAQNIIIIVCVVGFVIVLIVGMYYYFKRSELFCFNEDYRAKEVGRTETEDCSNEFVTTRLSQYESYIHDDFKGLSIAECVDMRCNSVYLTTELTSEVPYAEPFQRTDLPQPVYAVPFNTVEQNDLYSTPKFEKENEIYISN